MIRRNGEKWGRNGGQPERRHLFLEERKLISLLANPICGLLFLGPSACPALSETFHHFPIRTGRRQTASKNECIPVACDCARCRRFRAFDPNCAAPPDATSPYPASPTHPDRSSELWRWTTYASPQMIRTQRAGKEAILPQVSATTHAGVVILRVASVNSAQQNAQRILTGRHGDQMNVVGHQAPT